MKGTITSFFWEILISVFIINATLSNAQSKVKEALTEEKKVEKEEYSEAIEDNSILIEEAYNQEIRVVQHISNFNYSPSTHDFQYVFTQEWPAFGLNHQFSYTIPYSILNSTNTNGLGDIMLNYRYQLLYKEDFISISPRISLIIPTGNTSKGLGNGAIGLDMNIPFSKRINNYLVTHFNAGATIFPSLKDDETGFNSTLISYTAGLSGILLLNKNINFLLEYQVRFNGVPRPDNKTAYTRETFIAPGLRFAIDIGDLQIVPAIAIPFRFSSETSVVYADTYFYLSFEHPF